MTDFTPTPLDDLLGDDAPFSDDDFDAWAAQQDTPTTDGEPVTVEQVERVGRFRIDGPRTARWAIAKLRLHRDRLTEIETLAAEWRAPLAAEMARIDEWVAAESARPHQSVSYFANLLEQWAIENRTDTVKSFKLPGGTVSTRETAAKFEITDMDAAVTYAADHGLGTKVTTSITDLKPAVKIVDRLVYVDGALVPHAMTRWVPTHSAYDIEFTGADPHDGRWEALDPDTGEILPADALIVEGPFVVDVATGRPVEGLKPVPGAVTASVKLADG